MNEIDREQLPMREGGGLIAQQQEIDALRAQLEKTETRLKDLEDTLDTYWVNNVNKLRAEHKALVSVLERSEEYIACLNDSTAMGYDGATTRTVWRQSVEKARAILNA